MDDYREILRRHNAAISRVRPQNGHTDGGFKGCPHPDCQRYWAALPAEDRAVTALLAEAITGLQHCLAASDDGYAFAPKVWIEYLIEHVSGGAHETPVSVGDSGVVRAIEDAQSIIGGSGGPASRAKDSGHGPEARAVTAPQEPEPPFDDWASHIATDVDSKSDSQLEWEIHEALQKAYRHGQAQLAALTHAIEALRGEMEQIGTECSLDAWDSCWSKRVLKWAAILKSTKNEM